MFPDGRSSFFLAVNGNKHGVTVDMRDPKDVACCRISARPRRMLSSRTCAPARSPNSLDAPALIARNPGLIYCNMGAFGAVGPMKEKPGYDPLMQACGGIERHGGEDRPPVRGGLHCRYGDRHVGRNWDFVSPLSSG